MTLSLFLLCAGKADVNFKDVHGRSALSYASMTGDHECVRTLLGAGANPNLPPDTNGKTPLIYGAQSGCAKTVGMLILAGADVNATCEARRVTALQHAAKEKRVGCLKQLIDGGADVNIADGDGNTPLMLAVGRDTGISSRNNSALRRDCVLHLLMAGAEVNRVNRHDQNALEVFLSHSDSQMDVQLASWLVAAGEQTKSNIKQYSTTGRVTRDRIQVPPSIDKLMHCKDTAANNFRSSMLNENSTNLLYRVSKLGLSRDYERRMFLDVKLPNFTPRSNVVDTRQKRLQWCETNFDEFVNIDVRYK